MQEGSRDGACARHVRAMREGPAGEGSKSEEVGGWTEERDEVGEWNEERESSVTSSVS